MCVNDYAVTDCRGKYTNDLTNILLYFVRSWMLCARLADRKDAVKLLFTEMQNLLIQQSSNFTIP